MRQAGATLHRGSRASHYRGLSLRSTGPRRAGSVIVAHGPSCSGACGIFPDQGSNACPLRWQADSQPLRHQGSPVNRFLKAKFILVRFTLVLFALISGYQYHNVRLLIDTLFTRTLSGLLFDFLILF